MSDRIRQFLYVLTEYARKRCVKRKFLEEWIVATLEHPARTESDIRETEKPGTRFSLDLAADANALCTGR